MQGCLVFHLAMTWQPLVLPRDVVCLASAIAQMADVGSLHVGGRAGLTALPVRVKRRSGRGHLWEALAPVGGLAVPYSGSEVNAHQK
jgi:hypothetical protein